jgi:putative hydrolase of the HAD superfamily
MGSEVSQIEAVLFDLDDTLFDHTRAQNEVIVKVAGDYLELFGGIDDDALVAAFRKADDVAVDIFYTGVPLDEVRLERSRLLLANLGIGEDISDGITEKYIRAYVRAYYPIENAERVVQSLVGKYKLGIVSNGSREMQRFKLESLNILDHLDCMFFSEGFGIRKPDPEIFLAAADELGVAPAECLFVGNSYRDDVEGAKKVGMLTCWFNRHRKPDPAEVYHDYQVTNLDELLGILDIRT